MSNSVCIWSVKWVHRSYGFWWKMTTRYVCSLIDVCNMYGISLSTVVLNSRDCQEKLWLPKKHALKNNFKTILSQKLSLLFEEDLITVLSCFLSSFEVQSSSRMVRNNKLITATCTWIINAPAVYYSTCMCYACIDFLIV